MAGRRNPSGKRSPGGMRRSGWRGVDSFINIVPGDVVEAMESMGMDVLRVDESSEAHARCPAHRERTGREDKHPSFSVNVESGLFGCWSCGFKGRFADLVVYVLSRKELRTVDRAEAVAWIRARGTIRRVERLLAKKPVVVDTTKQINEASLSLYEPPPLWALESRGITAQAAARYGVLWDLEEDLWITPVREASGRLVGWQEKNKRYFRNRPEGMKKSQYVFGLHILPERCEKIVMVESPLDAAIVWGACGVECVATYGASISDRQMELVQERTNNVILFLDNDPPGRKARNIVMERWAGRGLSISTVDYSRLGTGDVEGLDPGALPDWAINRLVTWTVPASIAALTLS